MALDADIAEAKRLLGKARHVAILTGAGISAESGVPTFRDSDGLWEGHHIEDVATPTGFAKNPTLVWEFYNARRANIATVKPNPGHYALAQLQERVESLTIITQNVDGLHQKAGAKNILEVHGSLYRTRCTQCGEVKDRGTEPLGPSPRCPKCAGVLRPDIVWFHEALPPKIWQAAQAATEECDLFMVIGTSAVVYPAAGLIRLAREKDAPASILECNLRPTDASPLVTLGLYGPAGQILPKLLEA
jgi:NAD-dependent deacetylase